MEVKKIIIYMGLLQLILQACGGVDPKKEEFIGTWGSFDAASIHFNSDGSFEAKNLRVERFDSKNHSGRRLAGAGKWHLAMGQGRWEIDLRYDTLTDYKGGYVTKILVAGENGFLDNKPPWYLFEWVDEEGGERYKFLKNATD